MDTAARIKQNLRRIKTGADQNWKKRLQNSIKTATVVTTSKVRVAEKESIIVQYGAMKSRVCTRSSVGSPQGEPI